MNVKNIVLIGIIAGVISLTVSLSTRSVQTIVKEVPQKVGALVSPDIPFNYLTVGGVTRYYGKSNSLAQATTTVCSIQSPVATSTIVSASIRFDVSSTTSSRIYIGRGANTNATTTLLQETEIAANTKGTVTASTTPTSTQGQTVDGLDDALVIPPSSYINFGMKPTEANSKGTFTPTGACQATFETI